MKKKYFNSGKRVKQEDLALLRTHFLNSGIPNYTDFGNAFSEMYGRSPKAVSLMLGKAFEKKPVRGTWTNRKSKTVMEQPAVAEPKIDVQQTETAADVMTITGDITVVLTSRLLHNHTIKTNTVVFENNQIVIKL